MSQWVRLWEDMPNDPKWRSIARKSGRSISEVIAVFNFMLICAANASERGELDGWDDEDVATALDVDRDVVSQIYNAMQGKVLDGMRLKAWKKRQPLREDSSAERAKAWRERKRTQANAPEEKRIDTDPNSNEFGSARARARQKNRSINSHGRSNGTEGFVRSVLEDIENDRRRREEGAAEIVPMLQRER